MVRVEINKGKKRSLLHIVWALSSHHHPVVRKQCIVLVETNKEANKTYQHSRNQRKKEIKLFTGTSDLYRCLGHIICRSSSHRSWMVSYLQKLKRGIYKYNRYERKRLTLFEPCYPLFVILQFVYGVLYLQKLIKKQINILVLQK